MCVGSPTAGAWSSFQRLPDDEFETDRSSSPCCRPATQRRGDRLASTWAFPTQPSLVFVFIGGLQGLRLEDKLVSLVANDPISFLLPVVIVMLVHVGNLIAGQPELLQLQFRQVPENHSAETRVLVDHLCEFFRCDIPSFENRVCHERYTDARRRLPCRRLVLSSARSESELNSTWPGQEYHAARSNPRSARPLELSNMMMMGEPGIPKNAATILRSYASQIAAAEGWAGDPR